jgi:putative DNA methylase
MAARTAGKTKKEDLAEQIAAAVGAGREVAVETVDFSDPNRPRTCLEVDFPILPINQIAAIEGNAGKPIYQMSKWWARRRSSVFRAMLIAAATKAPDDESQAAKRVWELYYANHQAKGALKHLRVADPFMGGGTTLVEGSRLGMQMWGCDLNPVAWFVVKNELADVDLDEVRRLLADIEAEVKPMVMPYFACDGPDGEKGKWFRRKGDIGDEWKELPADFDIFSVPWAERRAYRYEGPEIIYTFWSKHGPCQRAGCGHRTPIMSTPVVSIKTLTVSAWLDQECGGSTGCGATFDLEQHSPRMAPDSPLAIAPDEKPFATLGEGGAYVCPKCGRKFAPAPGALRRGEINGIKPKNKKVDLTLLLHPQWLDGCPAKDAQGRPHGGSITDDVESTTRWNDARAAKLRLVEVRGKLPEQVTCPDTGVTFYTDERGGTAPLKVNKDGKTTKVKSAFACRADGSPNDNLSAIKATGKSGPMAAYVIQGYSAKRDESGVPYGGRFFAAASDCQRTNAAKAEWESRKDADLRDFWPKSEVPFGFMTHMNNGGIPNHGFTHFWTMFNPLQLLMHTQLLRTIMEHRASSQEAKEFVLGSFQQYLRNQDMFSIWNPQRDTPEPMFSNSNYHPKATVIENCFVGNLGRGNWTSCSVGCVEGAQWARRPWDVVSVAALEKSAPELSDGMTSKSVRAEPHDPVNPASALVCSSASDMNTVDDAALDLVITDPPFGGLLHYSELSDFFYVWLRLALKDLYPAIFGPEYTPKTLEAVANRARQPEDADGFYQRILTECWREAYRVLKPGGLLAFTFHHSEDEPWVGVLESLFDAGFYLEATYPIRSDETKGEGAKPGTFGSQQIEYDIVHVCRKRTGEPVAISWARLRRQIVDEVKRLRRLLEQHAAQGLPQADLQVIKRGKALEFFSRHYGRVYVEQGREFTIREALLSINLLLDEETSASGAEPPPVRGEAYTRQLFRIFQGKTEVPRNEMMNWLRGTGIAPNDFEEREWCEERQKVFHLCDPVEWAKDWKGVSRNRMARDFDQAWFLVGGCHEGSGIRVTDTLNSSTFSPHPATEDWLDWLARHAGAEAHRHAAQRARTIYRDWLAKNPAKKEEQLRLFDLEN